LRYRNNRLVRRGYYPIDRVVAGETFADVTVEVTSAADPEKSWFHSIRSLVLTDDAGEPDYLVLVIKDETDRFEAEERFESAFNANPAPAVICRVSDLCYVRANDGFIEMTGYSRRELIGASLQQIDVFANATHREVGLDRLKEGLTVPQMEAWVPVRGGGAKVVIVAGEPIEIAQEKCVLLTFADIDLRFRAERALRQSEERFAKSFRLSPVPLMLCKQKGFKLVEANDAFKAMTGHTEEEIIGRSPADFNLWVDQADQKRIEERIHKQGSLRNIDIQLRAGGNTLFDCLLSAETVKISDEPCVLCVIQDITERKQSEDELMAAIEAVMADTSWFSHGIVEKLTALRRKSRPTGVSTELANLTDRERDVLGFICLGQSDKEMSRTLKLSPNTIRNHVFSLYQKIGVNRRAAAIVWARERGISGPHLATSRKRVSDGGK
jgi:PAS domain S-box-containing protein